MGGRACCVFCVLLAAGLVAACIPARPAHAQGSYPIPAFSVQVTLSSKATARLAALREGMTVVAYYTGEPSPAGRRHADQMGQINLGSQEVALNGSTANFSGKTVKATEIEWVKDRDVQLLINVYSARRSGPNNLLDCGIYEDAVAAAAKAPVKIACKLIGEP